MFTQFFEPIWKFLIFCFFWKSPFFFGLRNEKSPQITVFENSWGSKVDPADKNELDGPKKIEILPLSKIWLLTRGGVNNYLDQLLE